MNAIQTKYVIQKSDIRTMAKDIKQLKSKSFFAGHPQPIQKETPVPKPTITTVMPQATGPQKQQEAPNIVSQNPQPPAQKQNIQPERPTTQDNQKIQPIENNTQQGKIQSPVKPVEQPRVNPPLPQAKESIKNTASYYNLITPPKPTTHQSKTIQPQIAPQAQKAAAEDTRTAEEKIKKLKEQLESSFNKNLETKEANKITTPATPIIPRPSTQSNAKEVSKTDTYRETPDEDDVPKTVPLKKPALEPSAQYTPQQSKEASGVDIQKADEQKKKFMEEIEKWAAESK